MNQPQDEDAILANVESGLTDDAILGGIEGVKQRLVSPLVPERIQGLSEAMNYGNAGIEFAIAVLKDESWDVQAAADWLLRQRQEPFVKQAQDEQQYQFKILIVDEKGQEINRQVKQGRFFAEQSASGVPLPMAYIPSGSFWMGSKETEIGRYSFESPQHLVTVSPLFMGIFPVTQAQWQAVAALPQVERILYP